MFVPIATFCAGTLSTLSCDVTTLAYWFSTFENVIIDCEFLCLTMLSSFLKTAKRIDADTAFALLRRQKTAETAKRFRQATKYRAGRPTQTEHL